MSSLLTLSPSLLPSLSLSLSRPLCSPRGKDTEKVRRFIIVWRCCLLGLSNIYKCLHLIKILNVFFNIDEEYNTSLCMYSHVYMSTICLSHTFIHLCWPIISCGGLQTEKSINMEEHTCWDVYKMQYILSPILWSCLMWLKFCLCHVFYALLTYMTHVIMTPKTVSNVWEHNLFHCA